MGTQATVEGTRRYAGRFAGRAAPEYFREADPAGGLVLSSLGIGTYLGEPDAPTDAAYTAAIVAAVRGGVNVIDSAINYRFQRSERSIGAALRQLETEGYRRDELLLCTKAGYLTPDGEMPADPGAYFRREYAERGVAGPGDVVAGMHCMTPRYLEDQLERSLGNLGVECVDVFYLHNPETQLSAVPRAEFAARAGEAFRFLESAAAAGKIRYYGMATWNGFRAAPQAPEYLSLEEMVALAREAGGDHHRFRFVQLPFNLAMPEALVVANQPLEGRNVALVEAAHHLGVAVVASASLLQAQLTRNLPEVIAGVLGLDADHERALQFARSAPGVTTALVGMSRTEHVAANLRLVEVSPAPPEQFFELFRRAE